MLSDGAELSPRSPPHPNPTPLTTTTTTSTSSHSPSSSVRSSLTHRSSRSSSSSTPGLFPGSVESVHRATCSQRGDAGGAPGARRCRRGPWLQPDGPDRSDRCGSPVGFCCRRLVSSALELKVRCATQRMIFFSHSLLLLGAHEKRSP